MLFSPDLKDSKWKWLNLHENLSPISENKAHTSFSSFISTCNICYIQNKDIIYFHSLCTYLYYFPYFLSFLSLNFNDSNLYRTSSLSLTTIFYQKVSAKEVRSMSPHTFILHLGCVCHFLYICIHGKLRHRDLGSISQGQVRGIILSLQVFKSMRKMSPFLPNQFFFSAYTVLNRGEKTQSFSLMLLIAQSAVRCVT